MSVPSTLIVTEKLRNEYRDILSQYEFNNQEIEDLVTSDAFWQGVNAVKSQGELK